MVTCYQQMIGSVGMSLKRHDVWSRDVGTGVHARCFSHVVAYGKTIDVTRWICPYLYLEVFLAVKVHSW